MDKETYEKQKAFAGEKVPSMHRRMVGHDYQTRQMYMITMVTEGRKQLFGRVVGKSDAPADSPDTPHIVPTELGIRVEQCWQEIALRYPQIKILAFQLMPDHFHGILFVKSYLEKPLGKVLLGFKQGCNKAYRTVVLSAPPVPSVAAPSVPPVPSVAVSQQQSIPHVPAPSVPPVLSVAVSQQQSPPHKISRKHGLLFEPNYNDKLLLRSGQLKRWIEYLHDNPRRLLMKREHPDLFRVQRGLTVGNMSFSAIGNRFLLQRPVLLQVQCSRRLTEDEIHERIAYFTNAAAKGAVLVSPAISPGEKAVMRAAFEQGYPLIYLQENGFTDLAKPGGERMDACARGQLLILAPWEHHNERITISRNQCLSLNEMAHAICSVCCCITATKTTATNNMNSEGTV